MDTLQGNDPSLANFWLSAQFDSSSMECRSSISRSGIIHDDVTERSGCHVTSIKSLGLSVTGELRWGAFLKGFDRHNIQNSIAISTLSLVQSGM